METEILSQGGFGFATPEGVNAYKIKNDRRYLNSLSRLVVMKYKDDGHLVSFIMTFIGDKEYMERRNFTLEGESYLKRDNELSGYVFYHTTEGEYVNGWQYKKGKVVGSVEFDDSYAPSLTLKKMQVYKIQEWILESTEYAVSSGGSVTVYAIRVDTYYIGVEIPDDGASEASMAGGGYKPSTPCDCMNVCPVCGKCKDESRLKSAGAGECKECTCPKIIDDATFVGTKADCVKQKLEKGNILNKLLDDFDLDVSSINLTFKVGILDITENGNCEFDNNTGRMDVTINTTRLNASGLQLARTILHESFHAYIYGKINETNLHNGLLPEPNFSKDFDAYQLIYGEQAQHNYIADDYIPFMKQALNDYLNNESYFGRFLNIVQDNVNWEGLDFLLECIAWEGLQGTRAYDSFMADPIKKAKYNKTMELAKLLPTENCN